MNITKIETDFNKKLFLKETDKIGYKKYSPKVEMEVINIYPDISYQTFIGFGGAFTDSSGYALSLLPTQKQDELINEYFSDKNLNYTLCRLPIGSSDFSRDSYCYSKKKDLSDFSIDRDKEYIIPTVKKAQKVNNNILFLSSPWSPPGFMKNTKIRILGGKLSDKYKNTFADYLIKYINSYKNEGIDINFMTIQNEPNAMQIWESCLYSPEEEIEFATKYLYPKLKENNISTKLLIWDHNKEKLYSRTKQELSNNEALNAISGIAFHLYSGTHFENIELTHQIFPDKLLIHTEGCTGYSHFNQNDETHNGEIYGHDIIGDLNAGANGYIDWNLILDYNGGPNHKKNFCNSPIMINELHTDYIKNLTFYYIAHFSKYIKSGAKRIAFSRYSTDIEMTCFKNPDESIIIVLMNKFGFDKKYSICLNNNIVFSDNLSAHSIITYIVNN